ncbi:MAG: hypothetical protein KA885_06655 [Spirochaetes bacterium]|nr:hypothetical protein [Spirochaetota bacterium]
MRRYFIILFTALTFFLFADEGFFLQGRTGILLKVDVEKGLTKKKMDKIGPSFDEIKDSYNKTYFETEILNSIKDKTDLSFINSIYKLDNSSDNYILDTEKPLIVFYSTVLKKNVLLNINNVEKGYLKNYKLDKKNNVYRIINENDSDIIQKSINARKVLVRILLLYYNSDNEQYSGIDSYGMPTPHKFPRTFDPYVKPNFDIHFVWGYRFINDLILGFSINFTNFVMPSLEISLKYNFASTGIKGIEPFVGGAIYGGFLDGFPIGFSALGGLDFLGESMGLTEHSKNLYLSAEARLGAVLYSEIYFDTGNNTEGIWKKFNVLAEGGFYFSSGYRWNKI